MGEIWHRGSWSHWSIVRGVFRPRARIVYWARIIIRIKSRLLISVGVERRDMNGPLGDLGERRGGCLARGIMGGSIGPRTIHRRRYLMVEWLLMWRLLLIELICSRTLDIGHRDRLLGTRLVHGLSWATFTVGRDMWHGRRHLPRH